MNIWAKMITALRGGVNEAGEAVVDTQALRILDQEIRDAKSELERSKDDLTEMLAKQKLAEEKVKQLDDNLAEYEGYASQALDKGDEALALEIAEKIANLENQRDTEKSAGKHYAENVNELREAIKLADSNIRRIQQQADTVKATDNVQRAQKAIAERHSGTSSKLRTATDSLERIKEKQALQAARLKASSELAGDTSSSSLEKKLESAGIKPGAQKAQEILDRLKAKK